MVINRKETTQPDLWPMYTLLMKEKVKGFPSNGRCYAADAEGPNLRLRGGVVYDQIKNGVVVKQVTDDSLDFGFQVSREWYREWFAAKEAAGLVVEVDLSAGQERQKLNKKLLPKDGRFVLVFFKNQSYPMVLNKPDGYAMGMWERGGLAWHGVACGKEQFVKGWIEIPEVSE